MEKIIGEQKIRAVRREREKIERERGESEGDKLTGRRGDGAESLGLNTPMSELAWGLIHQEGPFKGTEAAQKQAFELSYNFAREHC